MIALLGLILLVAGGEVLVRNSSALAIKAKVPPLIVGLTVISIGTSTPELFTSLQAAWNDVAGISVGNVIGSNIANLGLALGLTAIVKPILVDKKVLALDFPTLIVVTALFGLMAIDGEFSFVDGVVLISALAIYTLIQIRRSRRLKLMTTEQVSEFEVLDDEIELSYFTLIMGIALGCVLLYFGADFFINGAVSIAKQLGVSEFIIGVTVVAFGTSVPEIFASVFAALKGEGDLSIGNLIGSNVMNILLVLGGTSLTTDIKVEGLVMTNDYWWMLGAALLLYPILKKGNSVNRLQGALYVCFYIAYVWIAFG